MLGKEYTDNGYRIFPLPNGQKRPIPGVSWKKLVRSVPLYGWRGNVGVSTENFAVLDFDDPALIDQFLKKYRDRITTRVRTPGGGEHAYFAGDLRNAQSDGYDIRAKGGYIVVPPSTYCGKSYEFRTPLVPVSDLKPFPEEYLPKQKEIRVQPIEQCDTLSRITRARAWLVVAEPAEYGSKRHDKMFFACCRMFQMFRLTLEQAWPLILEYNERAREPFSHKELLHKLQDAAAAPVK